MAKHHCTTESLPSRLPLPKNSILRDLCLPLTFLNVHQTELKMEDTVKCTPPESLLKYANPLYVGIEPKAVSNAKAPNGQVTQLDDMLNSMLPPR